MENITGKSVKINVDKIKKRGKVSALFNQFLERNIDEVFTARLDVDNCYIIMYVLEEDTSRPKWLFYLEDLMILEE